MTNKEQEFIRLLLLQDKEIKQIFAETINALAGDLNHFTAVERALTPENIWLKNKRIEQRIEQKLLSFQSQFTSTLSTARAEALGISKKYGDEIINSYISNLPISGVAKEGIYLRSLEGFTAFQNKGLDIKESVWKTTQGLKDQIAFYGGSGVASGQASKRISTDLKNYLQHPDKRFRRIRDPKTGKLKLSQPAKNFHPGTGTYRSSYQNALRLAQTETNMAFRHADQMRWKEMAFVNGYEVKLSNAHPELDICDSMAGRYPKNFLFGGWHPKCICFIVPMMAPKKDFINYLKTGNLNQSQVINTIPGQAANYITQMTPALRNYKSKPYFIRDNFKLNKGSYILKSSVGNMPVITPQAFTGVSEQNLITAKPKPTSVPVMLQPGASYLEGTDIKFSEDFFKLIDKEKPVGLTISKRGNVSHFDGRNVVIVNGERQVNSKWYTERVIYHEYGHAIDHQRGMRVKLTDKLNEYRKNLNKPSGKTVTGTRYNSKTWEIEEYQTKISIIKDVDLQLKSLYSEMYRMSGTDFAGTKYAKMGLSKGDVLEQITSTMDSVMSINPTYGFGHSKSYFKRYLMREAEFIAHAFENRYVGNVIFKEYLPDIYEDTLKLINDLN